MIEKSGPKRAEWFSPLNIEGIKKNLQRIKELADGLKNDSSLYKELAQRLALLVISFGTPVVMVAFIVQPEIFLTAINTMLHSINPQLDYETLLGVSRQDDINKSLRALLVGASVGIVLEQQQPIQEARRMPVLEMYRRVALSRFKTALSSLSGTKKNDV